MLLLTDGKPSHTYLRVAEHSDVSADARATVYLDTTICSYLAARSQRDALFVHRRAALDRITIEVMAMASNVVYTAPHTFLADFTVPDTTRKKQRIRPKKTCRK